MTLQQQLHQPQAPLQHAHQQQHHDEPQLQQHLYADQQGEPLLFFSVHMTKDTAVSAHYDGDYGFSLLSWWTSADFQPSPGQAHFKLHSLGAKCIPRNATMLMIRGGKVMHGSSPACPPSGWRMGAALEVNNVDPC